MTKAEYKAEMCELMQRQRELAKQYHAENAARNEAQRLDAAARGGNMRKECYALNRAIGQLLAGAKSKCLNAQAGVSKFEMQGGQVVFTITIQYSGNYEQSKTTSKHL